jgi:hypothetical protein
VLQFCDKHGAITLQYRDLRDLSVEPYLTYPVTKPEGSPNHLLDVLYYLASAQALARHWLAECDGEDVRDAWAGSGLLGSAATHEDAWMQWVDCLNSGLAALRVRAELPVSWSDDAVVGVPRVGLYSALCIQIYNLATEGHRPRTCGDETCRRRFVRQRGGAKAGQYRLTGVTYCSPVCARREGQRKRRQTLKLMRS